MLPKGHKFPTENTGRSNLGNLTASFLPWQKYPRQMCMLSCCLNFVHCESIPLDDEGFYALKLIYLFIHSFIYLFLYNLPQEAWITHRASSTTSSRKKRRKLVIQLTRMKILRNDKKNANTKTEFGRPSIKNQQHIRSSKLFNGRLVWHLIHTLLKV